MEDVQNWRDERQLPIDQVGVSDLRYPIVVLDRAQQRQQTVASLTMAVDLPHHFKGTHMSRFVEVLNAYRGEVTMRTLPVLELLRVGHVFLLAMRNNSCTPDGTPNRLPRRS